MTRKLSVLALVLVLAGCWDSTSDVQPPAATNTDLLAEVDRVIALGTAADTIEAESIDTIAATVPEDSEPKSI